MTQWLMNLFVKNNQDTDNPAVRQACGTFASVVGIVCNAILSAAKMIIGGVAGSVSIVADGVNNLADAASSIISLLGFKLAGKKPDADHPYGHGRYEYLAGLVVAVLIMVIGVELLKSSIDKLLHPEPVEFSWVLVIVLVLAILIKLWMALFNMKVGKHINSQTLIATSADSRNDVISTAAVLVAALVSHFTGIELDAWMGIAVALFILWSGFGLVRDTIDPLLGGPPEQELVDKISHKVMSYDGVLGTHDLMVHDYGPGRVFASIHAEVAAEVPVLESHEIIDNIEADFRNNDGLEVVIHLDPIVTADPRIAELRAWLAELVRNIDERLTIHDFRMVPGESHTNLIFDCVKPYSLAIEDKDLKKKIERMVQETYPNYFCVIQVDKSYVAEQEK